MRTQHQAFAGASSGCLGSGVIFTYSTFTSRGLGRKQAARSVGCLDATLGIRAVWRIPNPNPGSLKLDDETGWKGRLESTRASRSYVGNAVRSDAFI